MDIGNLYRGYHPCGKPNQWQLSGGQSDAACVDESKSILEHRLWLQLNAHAKRIWCCKLVRAPNWLRKYLKEEHIWEHVQMATPECHNCL